MCGIAGIYGVREKGSLSKMMAALEHRGGDGCGTYIGKYCAIGHDRLSIIDLSSSGSQPMHNEDKTVWMAVNGEIYNYKALRVELESRGHRFESASDSEVIVHAYEQFGSDFVNRLRGMFALVVYDLKSNTLILARDPMGKKPLYYYADNNTASKGIVFASEMKALFEAGVVKTVNYDAVPMYLMYQHSLNETTIFAGVRMLPAGSLAVITMDGVEIKQYWDVSRDVARDAARDAARDVDANRGTATSDPVQTIRGALEESVRLRLQSDVPVGSFLSGGIDSSAVTALYRKFYTGDMHTFTAVFPDHSEAKYARDVSRYLGTIYHEVEITPTMVANDIGKITWHNDEPLGEAATINNFYLSGEAKKHVSVVLAGEGGDEVFGGYPYHRYVPYMRLMNALPRIVKIAGERVLQGLGTGDVSSNLYGVGRILQFPCQRDAARLMLYPTTATGYLTAKWLLRDPGTVLVPGEPLAKNRNMLDRLLALDCRYLLQKFLMKADKGTMAHAVEERLPLLDKEIVRAAFSLDPEMRKDKYVLRKSVEDLLPNDIVWRTKQGFGTPMDSWIASKELGGMVEDRINNGPLLKEVCKPGSLKKVAAVLAETRRKKGLMALKPTNVIWFLFALQVWHDVWFKGRAK